MWPFKRTRTRDDGSRSDAVPSPEPARASTTRDGPAGAGVVVANPPPPLRLVCVPVVNVTVPVPRSLMLGCDLCQTAVWVHLRVLLSLPKDVHAELWCGPCMLREMVGVEVAKAEGGR